DGIVLVKDLTASSATMQIQTTEMEVVNNVIYFIVGSDIGDSPHPELWKTSGESNNTLPVKVFGNNEGPFGLYNSNGTLFFSKFDYVYGQELWTSNGTDAGTRIVKDIVPGNFGSIPENLTFCNGKLLFRAADNYSGTELWSTDGTGPGTKLVKDINSATTQGSNAGFFYKGIASSGNGVIFSAYTPEFGGELYKSDGTSHGTVLLNDIVVGPEWSFPHRF